MTRYGSWISQEIRRFQAVGHRQLVAAGEYQAAALRLWEIAAATGGALTAVAADTCAKLARTLAVAGPARAPNLRAPVTAAPLLTIVPRVPTVPGTLPAAAACVEAPARRLPRPARKPAASGGRKPVRR